MKDSLNLDLKCALLLPPNHSLLVEIKCSDGMRGSANTFCAQFFDTALAKCRAALRGTHPEVGMRLPRWTTSRTAPCCTCDTPQPV